MKKRELKLLWEVFITFFNIGAFTIGGGYAMLPLIEKEVVDRRKWVKEEEIIDVFAVSQSIPGVIAINSAIFIGYKIKGFIGAVVAALGVILPSFFTILIIAYFLLNINNNSYIQKAFAGIRAGVVVMIGMAAIKLGKAAIKDRLGILLAVAAFIAIVIFDVSVILIIAIGGLIGYLVYGRNNH